MWLRKLHYITILLVFTIPHTLSSPLTCPSRFLDSTPSKSDSNIEIFVKSESADYHLTTFKDPNMFYCEKIMGPMGVNDICSLHPSELSFSKALVVPDLSSKSIYTIGENLLSFKGNNLNIYGLRIADERLRIQLFTSLTLLPEGNMEKIDNVHFEPSLQQVIIVQGTKYIFYKLEDQKLELLVTIENPSLNTIDFENMRVFYFKNKYVVLFTKSLKRLDIFIISEGGTLNSHGRIQDCQEIYVDSSYIYAFTNDKLKALDGQDDVTVDFQYTVKEAIKAHPSGVLVYAENRGDNKASVLYVEVFGKKGFRLSSALTCPINAQSIHLSESNLVIVYENWVRVYPLVKEKQFGSDFYFDFVEIDHILGLLTTKTQEYMVFEGENGGVDLYTYSKSLFQLECKKEKGNSVNEYIFQVRCITTKCETVDFTTQKFANNSCAYTRNVVIYPEEEGGSLGVALLVGLGFVAGIALTMGFGVFNCFGKGIDGEGQVKTHTPKDKKPFNINRGLRRHHTAGNESKKFLGGEVDETYPSEELRDSVIHHHMNDSKKKASQSLFETPRFTMGAILGHSNPTNANYGNYSSVSSREHINEGGETDKIGSEGEESEGRDLKGKSKVTGLKLSEHIKPIMRDLASFRAPDKSPKEEKEEIDEEEEGLGELKEVDDEESEKDRKKGDNETPYGQLKDEPEEEEEGKENHDNDDNGGSFSK